MMDASAELDEMILKFENRFRKEVFVDVDSGKLPEDVLDRAMPIIDKCIKLFAWAAVMQILEDEAVQ